MTEHRAIDDTNGPDFVVLNVTTSHFSYTTVVSNPCTGKTAGAICGTAPTSPCALAPTCQTVGGVLSCQANYKPATTLCRPVNGPCDAPDYCSGTFASCRGDALLPSGQTCRAAAGPCDVAKTCTGASPSCPTDQRAPYGTMCRSAAGSCDMAETCTGSTTACPPDTMRSTSSVCRLSTGACDPVETCTGTNPSCPADALAPISTICRVASGECDIAETCTGSSLTCTSDAFLASTSVCRGASGECDIAETCTGSSPTCPSNAYLGSTSVCRTAAGECDVAETCSGASATCPADALLPSTTVCRPALGVCDVAETCTGLSSTCPDDAFVTNDTPLCRDVVSCEVKALGGSAGEEFGFGFSAIGDITGDGKDDVGVGARNVGWGDFNADVLADILLGNGHDDSEAVDGGAVYLFNSPVASGTLDVSSESAVIRATTASEYFGNIGDGYFVVADFDGDRYDDVLVGSFGQTYVGATAGAVYLFLGPLRGNLTTANAAATCYGSQTAGEAAHSALAGDFNGGR